MVDLRWWAVKEPLPEALYLDFAGVEEEVCSGGLVWEEVPAFQLFAAEQKRL